jgi:hypothetical protein
MQYADGLKLTWASHDFIRRGPKTAIQDEHIIAEAAKPCVAGSSTSPLKTELSAAAVFVRTLGSLGMDLSGYNSRKQVIHARTCVRERNWSEEERGV